MASGHAWKLEYNWNVFFRLARSLTVRLEPGEDLAFATTEQQYEETFLVPLISQLLYLELCFFFCFLSPDTKRIYHWLQGKLFI